MHCLDALQNNSAKTDVYKSVICLEHKVHWQKLQYCSLFHLNYLDK